MIENKDGIEYLNAEDITENVIAIKINQEYSENISEQRLYDVTRSSWKVNIENAQKVDYAFSIFDGIVLEVYKVAEWLKACETFNEHTSPKLEDPNTRYEFVGNIAEDEVRNKYKGKSVKNLYVRGEQAPFKYFINKWFNNTIGIHNSLQTLGFVQKLTNWEISF